MANAINWFEIPAKDLDRACSFYSSVLRGDIHREEIMGQKMGFLPHGQQEVGGALVETWINKSLHQCDGMAPSLLPIL